MKALTIFIKHTRQQAIENWDRHRQIHLRYNHLVHILINLCRILQVVLIIQIHIVHYCVCRVQRKVIQHILVILGTCYRLVNVEFHTRHQVQQGMYWISNGSVIFLCIPLFYGNLQYISCNSKRFLLASSEFTHPEIFIVRI